MPTPRAASDDDRRAAERGPPPGGAPSIGFLVDWLDDSPFQWAILRGVIDETEARGGRLLCFVGGRLGEAQGANDSNWIYDLARPTNVDALLLLSTSLGNATGAASITSFCDDHRQTPICSISVPLPDVESVGIDNVSGMRALVEHLVRVHELHAIAFVCGPQANAEAEMRLATYRAVLKENGIPFTPELVVPGDFSFESGRQAVATLFDERKLPYTAVRAIVGANDLMALGALEAVQSRSIRVPEQMAVAGFDDIEQARFAAPPLTTVRQPLDELGRGAARLLFDRLRDGRGSGAQALHPTRLVARRSCGCIAQLSARPDPTAPIGGGNAIEILAAQRQSLFVDLERAAAGALDDAGYDWRERLFAGVSDQLATRSSDAFLRAYNDVLRLLVDRDEDPSLGDEILTRLRARVVPCVADLKGRSRIEDAFHEARILTFSTMEGAQVERRHRAWTRARALMQAGAEMASAQTMADLARVVHERLPSVGIRSCFIVRVRRREGGETTSRFELVEDSRAPPARVGRSNDEHASRAFLRESVLGGTRGAFALFPVTLVDGDRGLLALEIGTEGYGYEVIRRILQGALGRISGPDGD
jgi:DNA-binding LacI/PurR family transcriptional regulator